MNLFAGAASRATAFARRLPRDWVVTASRTSIFRFFYQMVLPYLSIYTLGLGARGSDLGLVNAAGLAAAALLAPFTGTLIDRLGPKKIYLGGIALLGAAWLVYGFAQSWPVVALAMVMYYIGFRTSGHCCAGICATSLAPGDRATAMSCCETLAAGLLGIVAPMVGTFIVALGGGMTVGGIRPLFFICFAGTLASFFLVYFKLSDSRRAPGGAALPAAAGAAPGSAAPKGPKAPLRPGFFKDLPEVFRHGRQLKRFVAIAVIAQLPQSMIIPFTQPFAAGRGAREFVLGAMVTGFALTPLVFGIPFGRLADRIGRKKVIYIVSPLFWLSCALLFIARSDAVFILAGVLQGAYFISSVVTGALQFELVEPAYIGRWLGAVSFFQMLVQAALVLVSGFVWDSLGPQYVFLIAIGLDMFVKMPLLMSVREKPRTSRASSAAA